MRGSALRFVSERFPRIAERLARQLECDETLHDLCEDLQACAEAASRLGCGRESTGLRKEYAALRLRLERELLRQVEEHGEDRVSPPGRSKKARGRKPTTSVRRAPAQH